MLRSVDTVKLAPDLRWRVPVLRFDSESAGPTVVIAANVHGDEVIGTVALQALDSWLASNLERGRVALYPTLNPAGLSSGTRCLPTSMRDLNRLFPGQPDGQADERYAAALWADLIGNQPDLVVDLHSDSACAIPYTLVDRTVGLAAEDRAAMNVRLLSLAESTGLLVLWEYPDEQFQRYSLDSSLTGAMVNREGVAALTIEVGPRKFADPMRVSQVLDALLLLLAELGMIAIEATERRSEPPGYWRRAAAPRAGASGLFVPLAQPGEVIERGDVIGLVRAPGGDVLERVVAREGGKVVGWVDHTWVTRGDTVGTLAVREL